MRRGGSSGLTALVSLSITALLSAPGGAAAAWMRVAATQTSAAAQGSAAAPAAAQTAPDGGWPRSYTAPDGGRIVLYEPQIASWDNQQLLTLYAAVSYTPAGSGTAMVGTIKVEADTRVSVEDRLVDFSSFRILESNFPNASKEQTAAAVAAVKASVPLGERVIALDRVLAYLDTSTIRPNNIEGVIADPPAIFYSTRPAILINLDGDPIWSPIRDNDLKFAVNTNWDLFDYAPSQTFYLRNESTWLKAPALTGPWTAAGTLPPSFAKLPADDNWADVRAALPGGSISPSAMPTVFVSARPAELILVQGEPEYEPVPGTSLLWVSNTESDVFRLGMNGAVYFLVAGRWFSSPGFTGPWTFATPSLPADFARIPLEHERSRVLASVPGTPQAAEAVLLAEVPQTARVNKKTVKAPDVEYQGSPDFQPIDTTTVARAVNTVKDIFQVGERDYRC
jgi:hypothetical protein